MFNIQMVKSRVVEGRAACAIERKGRERRVLCLALYADRWPPHDPHMEFAAAGEVRQEGHVVQAQGRENLGMFHRPRWALTPM